MAKKEEKNIKDKTSFMKKFKAELKKVVWPTPKQLFNNTVAVLSIVLITAIIVFVLDITFESMNKYGINKVTLSRELSKTELEDILKYNLDIDTELIVYGTLPIMSCNYCFLGKSNMCYPECKRLCSDDNSYYLKDRLGFKFRIVSDNIQSITSIFNSKILSISPKTFNVSSVRIDILDENVTTVNKIIETVKSGKSFEGKEYTSGRLEEEK